MEAPIIAFTTRLEPKLTDRRSKTDEKALKYNSPLQLVCTTSLAHSCT